LEDTKARSVYPHGKGHCCSNSQRYHLLILLPMMSRCILHSTPLTRRYGRLAAEKGLSGAVLRTTQVARQRQGSVTTVDSSICRSDVRVNQSQPPPPSSTVLDRPRKDSKSSQKFPSYSNPDSSSLNDLVLTLTASGSLRKGRVRPRWAPARFQNSDRR